MVSEIRTPRVQDGRLPRLLFILALLVLVAAATGYFAWTGVRQQVAGPSGLSIRVPMPPSLPRGPQMPDPPLPTAR